MNFTKEYIQECDCKEIRGLKKEFEFGDWYRAYSFEPAIWDLATADMRPPKIYKDDIWLPTGDQLDDEIVKICEKDHDYDYELYFDSTSETWILKITDPITKLFFETQEYHENILTAKIKLLKALLEA